MNEFGEPNMGNPSVRFDEGRSGSAGLTTAVSSKPPPSTSPALLQKIKKSSGIEPLRGAKSLHPAKLFRVWLFISLESVIKLTA